MKTNTLSILFVAGTLAGSAYAQQPNPVISGPPSTTTPSSTSSQPSTSTGGRITSAVENFLGRFLNRNQSQMNFDQLPQPVQNTVRGQAGTAAIQNVSEVKDDNGQITYAVTYNQNGKDITLQLDPSGRLLNSGQFGTASPMRLPLAAPSPVGFYQLPPSVQATLQQDAQGSPIQRIQRGTVQGQTVYQADFQHNGQSVQLRLDQNGMPLRDMVNDQYLASIGRMPNSSVIAQPPQNPNMGVGRAPIWQSGGGSSSSSTYAPPSDLNPVSFNQLPQAVQTTLNSQVGGAPIDRISQSTLNGRTVYDVTYDQGGRQINLRLGDDGSVLSSSDSTAP